MPAPTLVVIRQPIQRIVAQRVVQKVVAERFTNRVVTSSPGPQGPQGIPGGGIRYEQSFSAASTVIVSHNLNLTSPDVVIWVGDKLVDADVDYGSTNSVTVAFGSPQTGRIGVS